MLATFNDEDALFGAGGAGAGECESHCSNLGDWDFANKDGRKLRSAQRTKASVCSLLGPKEKPHRARESGWRASAWMGDFEVGASKASHSEE
jgi:hypothetical protein